MNLQPDASGIDPVCGMTVTVAAARAAGRAIEHEGITYVFCSTGCLVDFRESPESYEGPQHQAVDRP